MKDGLSIAFTGDIGFDGYMNGKWNDEELISGEVMDFIASCDHVCVNVEGALSAKEKVNRKNTVAALTHSMDPEVTGFLKRIKADIWNICNNHIMDAGPDGLFDTLDEAKAAGASTIGAGMDINEASRPLIIPDAGGIGIFAVGYQRACRKADENTAGCLSWSDLDRIRANIDNIKKTCRHCVIVAHAGEEFTALPSPYTRERYLKYLEMGADIVVAHHPHVPMNYETVGDKALFYSLGNLVFDTDYQRSQYYTEYGIVLKINFTNDSFSFESMGIKTDRDAEKVVKDRLPDIFTDISEGEYNLLLPLSAKAFLEATKRQQTYLYPDKYKNATEKDWHENFYEPLRSGRVPGETLDLQIICPIAEKEKEKAWEKSKLEGVKEYILKMLKPIS